MFVFILFFPLKANSRLTSLQMSVSDLHIQASVFVQSHVRAHAELMWLLSSATPIGWLNKMIQFKEKSRKAVRL